MDHNSAPDAHDEGSPVFAAYRRGYDPDQVDRYVTEQSRLLDAAHQRAEEAERKLAAAVSQLRDARQRIAATEQHEQQRAARPVQSVPLDALGERIQRILEEAWDGADQLRQGAEADAASIREQAVEGAEAIVAQARGRAESMGEEMRRRRQAYLERLEVERSKAVTQMGYLHEQRKLAIADLHRVKTLVDATITEVTTGGRPPVDRVPDTDPPATSPAPRSTETPIDLDRRPVAAEGVAPAPPLHPRPSEPVATMPVHRIPSSALPSEPPDTSNLVRNHRAAVTEEPGPTAVIHQIAPRTPPQASVFDFDDEGTEEP